MLTIYGVYRSRASRNIWLADELGVPFKHVPVIQAYRVADPNAKDAPLHTRSPAFLKVNPNGHVPSIEDDGVVLHESLAINLYLAKKHSVGKLYPASLGGEAKAWQWSLWAVTEVDRGVNIWSLHAVRLPPGERDAGKREEALQVLKAPFKVLDDAVAKQPYLLGGDFTVADLNVAAVISRAIEMDLSATPHLGSWLRRCLDRPAAREALALKAKADAQTPADVTRLIARRNRL